MNIFSNKSINIITLIITIIIFIIINSLINKFQNEKLKVNERKFDEIIFSEEEVINEEEEQQQQENLDWYVEVASINLKAPIKETTHMEILNEAVGHFEETALTLGNIGLAAHNKGYKNNYFENLKNIKKGDVIKYQNKDFIKTYEVNTIEVINNTDWSYLEETDENKITLITCIENRPNHRLCVQAIEK